MIKDGDHIRNRVAHNKIYQRIYDEILQMYPQEKMLHVVPSNQDFLERMEPYKDKGGSLCLINDMMGEVDQGMSEVRSC